MYDKYGTGVCDYDCPGDSAMICGGYLAFTAYEVGTQCLNGGRFDDGLIFHELDVGCFPQSDRIPYVRTLLVFTCVQILTECVTTLKISASV